MRKRILKNILKIVFFMLMLLLCFFVIMKCEGSEVSNKMHAWGFKREGSGKSPTFDKTANSIIEKYEGISVGNKDEKIIYITFDCGYEAGYTEQILDVLKENNVKASFFITGHYLNSAEDIVKRMIEEGHIVGNHTVNHKCLPKVSDKEIEEEIRKLDTALYQKFNYEMSYFRPPKGEFSERVVKKIKEMGYTTVMWSSAYDDWDESKQNREEYGTKKILENLHNGCVLLLHSTSKDNANIFNNVIKEIKNQGYEIKNIDEFKW